VLVDTRVLLCQLKQLVQRLKQELHCVNVRLNGRQNLILASDSRHLMINIDCTITGGMKTVYILHYSHCHDNYRTGVGQQTDCSAGELVWTNLFI